VQIRAMAGAAGRGAVAGIVGVAGMTVSEKLEQLVSHRADSYVPAHTLARLLGLSRADADSWPRNMLMHWGNGVVLGAVRGVMAAANLRGPRAALMHTPLRLTWDQMWENLTGVGAPPWTWPRDELVIDVFHKAVFSLVTGAVADRLVEPLPSSSASRSTAGSRLKGFA
jgi:hypothetical protein